MRDGFSDYTKQLGMGAPLTDRVAALEGMVEAVLPEPISFMFVSEYLEQNGSRQYSDLYFLSTKYVAQVANFVNTSEFQIDYVGQRISNLKIDARDFDFVTASEASRLNIGYYTVSSLRATLMATKENCLHLLAIARACFLPNATG